VNLLAAKGASHRATCDGWAKDPYARWAVDLVLKNMTDKLIFLGGAGGTSLPASTGSTLLQIDQPRNVAIQAVIDGKTTRGRY
jgi:hypothetical protein